MALQKKIKLIHDAISTRDFRSALKLCNRKDLTHIPVVKARKDYAPFLSPE